MIWVSCETASFRSWKSFHLKKTVITRSPFLPQLVMIDLMHGSSSSLHSVQKPRNHCVTSSISWDFEADVSQQTHTLSSVTPSGLYKYRTSPFFIFRWPLAMLFSGWTLLSFCRGGLSCKIDVKCLDDKLSCKNIWSLIHTWVPSGTCWVILHFTC